MIFFRNTDNPQQLGGKLVCKLKNNNPYEMGKKKMYEKNKEEKKEKKEGDLS